MASGSVKDFNAAWWAEVNSHIIGAIVFIDEGTAECLHWEGGIYNLMLNGAKCVKLLSSFEFCPPQFKKAVFITQADRIHLQSIRDIIHSTTFTQCVLLSTISLEVLYLELVKDPEKCDVVASGYGQDQAAKLLSGMLYEWMAKKRDGDVIASAYHIPIFTIAMTNVIFTMPPFKDYYPGNNGQFLKAPVPDLQALDVSERMRVRKLACALNSMLDSMNMKEDVYFMGNYSSLVAGVLENSPIYVNRRKNSQHPTSLIIVDRTLDLCSVSSHGCEAVLDKLRLLLPAFPGHAHDCAVDMSPLCHAKSTNHPNDIHMSPGCVYHSDDDACTQTFDHMINKTQKEVMLDVYNKLSKIDVHKSPSPKNLLKVTPQSLEKIIYANKGNYKVIDRHLGVLQQGLALIQMHKAKNRASMDLLMSLEKQVLESLATSRESTSVLTQIANLIATRKHRGLPLENLIGLLIHVYSLSGTEFTFASTQQQDISEALTVAVKEEYQTLFSSPAEDISVEMAKEIADGIMTKLNDIKFMRKSITKYNSLLKPCESGDGYEYRGLLQQLVEDLVNSARPEMPDLQHRSDGLKDLFRTGLSMLSGKNAKRQKHPLDNPTVVFFIIGGTSAEECKLLHRSVITSGVDNTVLFGSTRLLTPQETARQYMAF